MAQERDTEVLDDTHWLDADQQAAWRSFLSGTTVLLDRLDRDLREAHDLSMPEYEILVRLSEAPDRRVRMALLADSVSQSRSRMTHTISRLSRSGYVERIRCDVDGRGVFAQLTPAGFDALADASHTHVRGVRAHLVDLLSSEQLQIVGDALGVVRDELGGPRL